MLSSLGNWWLADEVLKRIKHAYSPVLLLLLLICFVSEIRVLGDVMRKRSHSIGQCTRFIAHITSTWLYVWVYILEDEDMEFGEF